MVVSYQLSAISYQPSAYALRARYANSHQPMRYAHATRTAISLCATRTLREQPWPRANPQTFNSD
ncbi:MAG: hypothetical protein F6J98_08720 [Moorea sp. SIO4G2]|nr:hypothetical protein [Moorena sp. SIO4G2]